MANTRDVLGDQETLDGLVSHTLTEFEEDGVTTMRSYAFYRNDAIESVGLPALKTVSQYAFSGCTSLNNVGVQYVETIDTRGFENCKSLSSIGCDSLTRINTYAFSGCSSLNSIDTSKVTAIGDYAFQDSGIGKIELPLCTSLGTYTGSGQRMSIIDISKNITIAGNKFNNANGLVHLILRSDTLCSLSASSAFTNTPIAKGVGWIYVPTDLVSTYKTATNWSTYADQIVSTDEYPKRLQNETITDSWEQIFEAENDGSYSTKYSVGDIKYVDIGGTQYPMVIIAMNKDALSAGGTAKITWCGLGTLQNAPMNFKDVTTNGWTGSWMRKFLRESIYPQIESTVRSNIKEVTKTYYDVTTSSTLTTTDTVFIPSAREIFGGSSYESTGIDYTDVFNSNTARIKHYGQSNSASSWWLRSADSATNFRFVNFNGSVSSNNASRAYGVALCFCT